MKNQNWKYDFFIAHAGGDRQPAQQLYGYLKPKARAFLDSENLLPGDNWNSELAAAQRNSLVTVVLVSSRSGAAYYQSEEIAAAISLARENPDTHRVVPVYIEPVTERELPYGLRIKHSLDVAKEGGMAGIAARLLGLLDTLINADAVAMAPATAPPKSVNPKSAMVRATPGQTVVKCAKCQGTGTEDRDGKPPACKVCDGGGYVVVTVGTGQFVECRFCAGDGTQDRDGRNPVCPVCHGVGGYGTEPGAVPCAACQGTGTRDRDGKLPICEKCGGRGVRHLDSLRSY
jgi:hypothetical protein